MQLGLLSHGQLAFDPFKPIILRGLPTEDASTLFAGNVVLSLSKPTKISNVSVTLKSVAVTYWPEGIGSRGTRLTAEKQLGEQTLEILAPNVDKKAPVLILPAGTHRFSFAFVIPNSTVATIEDTFGRVRHTLEAEVQRPGIVMLSSWHISKPVMILRTYMSNSLLINNSLNNLSRTFEKHMVYGDIEVLIEAAAFSSGELFYIRMIIEPQLKHTRLEHMEVNVTETRKYCVPEMKAWRNDETTFSMPFAGSVRLAEFGEVDITTDQLKPVFDKEKNGIELVHDFAHRLAFYTPTCQQNIRHTTYLKEISIRHHIEINLTLSYQDVEGNRQCLSRTASSQSLDTMVNNRVPDSLPSPIAATPSSPTMTMMMGTPLTPPPAAHIPNNYHSNNSSNSRAMVNNSAMQRMSRPSSTPTSPSHNRNASSSYTAATSTPTSPTAPTASTRNSSLIPNNNNSNSWQNVLLRLHKTITTQALDDGRSRETITLDSPITVFDCRLKEDYGKLPSYHELGVKPSMSSYSYNDDKGSFFGGSNKNNKQSSVKITPRVEEATTGQQPKPYLCSCYYAFCREMELASQALYLPSASSSSSTPAMPLLDRIPSIPPPDYAA